MKVLARDNEGDYRVTEVVAAYIVNYIDYECDNGILSDKPLKADAVCFDCAGEDNDHMYCIINRETGNAIIRKLFDKDYFDLTTLPDSYILINPDYIDIEEYVELNK